MQRLFESFPLGPLNLTSRIVMAPMTRSRAVGNLPNDLMVTYYQQRASAGLILTEATQVSPRGVGYPNTPGIHDAEQVAGWRKITDAVHAAGGRIFLQLWHVGRISHPSMQPDGALPVGPSPIAASGQIYTATGMQDFVAPRALSLDEIPGIVAEFASGARHASDAGFDGVEIHGANGYLLDQFLRDGTNRRTDAYGGPVENRARLMVEVTEAVAKVWGADRVGVRLSPTSGFNSMSDSDPRATFTHAAARLGALKIAYLHVIEPLGQELRLAADLKQAFGGVFMLNGGYTAQAADAALAAGEADLISFGVPFIGNPDLPRRFAENLPLAQANPKLYYTPGARGYIDYPALA